jgi:VCBS repeat protein/FG-GAP repeat protein
MKRYRNMAALLLAVATIVCGGCGGTAGTSGVSPAAGVVLKNSQQGQSGGMIDYDGDGIEDLVVGAPYSISGDKVGALLIYKGSANGFTATPTWLLTGDDNFGYTFANLGDVDGDGKADFAVGAYNGDGADVSLSGSVAIYKGGSGGKVIAKPAGETALDKFGLAIKGGCDLNGDGIKDLVVGAPYHSPGPDRYQKGAVYVYFGPDFKEATRVKLSASLKHKGLGNAVTCGDLNGDGIGDLIIGASGKVLAYYGKPGFGPATDTPDVVISNVDGKFGSALAVLGDLNGDGLNELAIGAANATTSVSGANKARVGRIYLVKGGAGSRTISITVNSATATPNANADILTWIDGAAYFDCFGFAVAPTGDMDGDGKPDLAASAVFADKDGATSLATGLTAGKVYLLKGKDLKTDGTATLIAVATVFNGPGFNMQYGNFLYPFSKNGPRLLVGAPHVNKQAGSVYGVSLQAGSSAVPIFSAGGPGNSTTDHSCCE